MVASGYKDNTIRGVIDGERIGTIFVAKPNDLTSGDVEAKQFEKMVQSARDASRLLQMLSADDRTKLLNVLSQQVNKKKRWS